MAGSGYTIVGIKETHIDLTCATGCLSPKLVPTVLLIVPNVPKTHS